jgi:uncharacterized protein (UPF0335 family)
MFISQKKWKNAMRTIDRLEHEFASLESHKNKARRAIKELGYDIYGADKEAKLSSWGVGLLNAVKSLSKQQNNLARNQDLILEHLELQIVDLKAERILTKRED